MKNTEKFVDIPKLYPNRTVFDFHPTCTTSMNVGDLVPLYEPIEIIPGDTFKVRTNSYIEMTTLIDPIMDSLYFDVFYFWCPFRILWENYIYFYGENKEDPYDSNGVYSMPQVEIPEGGYQVGTIADYMNVPIGRGAGSEINALYFRGYAKIVNEFFISDYINSKANENYNVDSTITGSNGDNYVTDLVKGGKPFVVNKLFDMFTACLPKPQAGDSVKLPLGDNAPIYTGDELDFDLWKKATGWNPDNPGVWDSLKLKNPTSGSFTGFNGQLISNSGGVGVNTSSMGTQAGAVVPTNLYADLSLATATTIGQIRQAVAVQHLLESESRHGNRFFEQLVGDYGVVNPDLRLQRPEFLGGSRFVLNVNKVVQSSQSTDTSAQGTLTAYSVTTFSHQDFTKSFLEPGLLFSLGCIRYQHSYSQGLPIGFSKKDKYDYYNHHFDGIGEQPLLSKRIYFDGTSGDDDVFGYMPYATEYRNLPNIITGEMRPDYSLSLDSYHFGDNYSERPALSPEWLKEDKSNVDRTLVVQSSNSMQFKCQFGFSITARRPISFGGIPGLRRL